MRKKMLSLTLALVIALSLAVPGLAASTSVTTIQTEYRGIFAPDNGHGWSGAEFSEGLAAVRKDRKYGYIDSVGKTVIPLKYDYALSFSEGLAAIGEFGNNWMKCGYIDCTGKVVIPLKYNVAGSFSEGLAAVGEGNEDWKCGYIDRTGKMVISMQYDDAYDFSEGLAVVSQNKKYGYIDRTGKIVIAMQYDWAESFSNGFAVVEKNGKYGYIDRTGTVVIPLQYDEAYDFSDGLATVGKMDKDGNICYNYVDTTGKLIVPQEYGCGEFSEELIDVYKEDENGNYKCGYVDRTGTVVIPLQYDSAASFSEGMAAVEKDGKWGYIDRTGKVVIPVQYDDAYRFSDGVAVAVKNGKASFIDTTGKFVASFPSKLWCDVRFSNGIAIEPNEDDKLLIFKKTSADQPFPPVIARFLDVSVGAYYAAPVQWAVEKGITAGTSATTFSPDNTCITAQILTFLWRAKGSPAPTKRDPSVPGGQYYSDAANWALERGLTDRFRADAPATRLATVTYLWKLAGSPAVTSGTSFTDVTENTQAVAWAVKQGITKGTSDTTFSPSTTCTRGQIVTFLHRDLAE